MPKMLVGGCYGQNLVHGVGNFPHDLVYNELKYSYQRGRRILRCGGSNYQYAPGWQKMDRNVFLTAKEVGYTDIMFALGGAGNTTLAQISPGGAYYQYLSDSLEWIEANRTTGTTFVNWDNEPELHLSSTVTRDQLRLAILEYWLPLHRLKAPHVKGGFVASNNNWQYMKSGITNSIGDTVDYQGVQLYGGGGSLANFYDECKDAVQSFGVDADGHPRAILSEESLHSTYGQIPQARRWHEWLFYEKIKERLEAARAAGFERVYPFCDKWDDSINQSTIGNDQWAFIKETGYCTEGMNHMIDEEGYGDKNVAQWMSTY